MNKITDAMIRVIKIKAGYTAAIINEDLISNSFFCSSAKFFIVSSMFLLCSHTLINSNWL
jgi:hypothetical protein